VRLSIIVASCGRPSLRSTISSITSQMIAGDELLLSVNDDSPWGNAERNRMINKTNPENDMILFMDDDDAYIHNAFQIVRDKVKDETNTMHIFKMEYDDGGRLWNDKNIADGNVSTQMICVPNIPDRIGRFGDRYQGDFDFIKETDDKIDVGTVWHDDVIALVRP
jgi:hypothetical protein